MKFVSPIIRAFFSAMHMDCKRAESEAKEYGNRFRRIHGKLEGYDPKTRSWRPVKWSDIK